MTMSYISLSFSIVFFGLIASCCFFNVYSSRDTISQAIEFSLQVIIEYLTDLQLHVRQQIIKFSQANFCKEECKTADVNNNYDLSKYAHQCPHHRYHTRIIERSPLIIYIEQFLTQNEIQYLIELA
jgi:hypothetical protein